MYVVCGLGEGEQEQLGEKSVLEEDTSGQSQKMFPSVDQKKKKKKNERLKKASILQGGKINHFSTYRCFVAAGTVGT